jgi:hypothetical protein
MPKKDCALCKYHPECSGEETLGPDPFRQEIHDDNTEVWMCEGERYESAMDI